MPIYEYQCTACKHHFDTIQALREEPLVYCPVCGEPELKKLISAPAFHLKGTGWYVTDFKNSKKSETGNQKKKEVIASDDNSKKEAPKKELTTKTAETTDNKTSLKKSDTTD